jgi:hypothetical protein
MAPILSANKAAELARATLACAAGCLLTAGCATFSPSAHKDQKPEPGTVSQVMVMWQPQVQMSLDPVHGGTSVPCLAGRLYLFGPDDKVHTAEGTVRVNLYSDDVHGPDGQPFLASYWQLDSAKLKSALRKDTVGWGYTLILPLAKGRWSFSRQTRRSRSTIRRRSHPACLSRPRPRRSSNKARLCRRSFPLRDRFRPRRNRRYSKWVIGPALPDSRRRK